MSINCAWISKLTKPINFKLNKNGQAYCLTVLTPIKKGQVDELRNTLVKTPLINFDNSLATTPLIHKPRFDIIENLPFVDTPVSNGYMQDQYLLFSCTFDTGNANCKSVESDLDAYLQKIFTAMPQEINLVWGLCVNFPNQLTLQNFQNFIKKHQITGGLFFADTPNNTPEQVRRSLFEQKRCINFIVKAQNISVSCQT